jgi:predicted deacylase
MGSIKIGGIVAEAGAVERGNLEVFRLAGGTNTDIPAVVINGEKEDGGPVVNVHAGIHGDEFEGIEATWRLAERIKPKNLSGTIVATPIVHLAAYGAGIRESPIDGKNLARVFPGDERGTATDKIAHTFFNEVVLKCDYVIGLHSGGFRKKFHPLIEYYEGIDPEVGRKARAAARAFCVGPFDIMQRIGNPPRNVTCTSEASRHGIPGIEGEMWGEGRCVEEHVEQYLTAVLSELEDLSMFRDRKTRATSKRELGRQRNRPLRHCEGEWTLAENGGFFSTGVEIEETVTKGQLVGVIKRETGELVETVRASASGFVAAIHTFPMVRPGDGIIMIERRVE